MTWQEEAISKWHQWRSIRGHEAVIIPPDIQVGKILEACECDVDKSEQFIKRQIAEDENEGFHIARAVLDANYWLETREELRKHHVNDLMLGGLT